MCQILNNRIKKIADNDIPFFYRFPFIKHFGGKLYKSNLITVKNTKIIFHSKLSKKPLRLQPITLSWKKIRRTPYLMVRLSVLKTSIYWEYLKMVASVICQVTYMLATYFTINRLKFIEVLIL